MTIWLLTLPEKFKEWPVKHDQLKNDLVFHDTILSPSDGPFFPKFSGMSHTTLVKNDITGNWPLVTPPFFGGGHGRALHHFANID